MSSVDLMNNVYLMDINGILYSDYRNMYFYHMCTVQSEKLILLGHKENVSNFYKVELLQTY